MSTNEIASGLVALCQQEKSAEAVRAYYSPDFVGYEAVPQAPATRGIDAALAGVAWWDANMEVHSGEVTGPFINGDQFAVRFTYDITDKTTGKRSDLDEVGLYTVQNGKITEARFLYSVPMLGCE